MHDFWTKKLSMPHGPYSVGIKYEIWPTMLMEKYRAPHCYTIPLMTTASLKYHLRALFLAFFSVCHTLPWQILQPAYVPTIPSSLGLCHEWPLVSWNKIQNHCLNLNNQNLNQTITISVIKQLSPMSIPDK